MGTHYRTLLINDIAKWDRRLGAWRETKSGQLAFDINSTAEFVKTMRSLVASGDTFDAAVFSTHGNKGMIFFGGEDVQDAGLYRLMQDEVDYGKLFPKFTSRILFAGCNVAEGDHGWRFLFAAARCFLRNGGETFGWTSKGFQAPFGSFSGRIGHPWGDTKQVRNMRNGSFRFYVNWNLIESGGVPQAPKALAHILH